MVLVAGLSILCCHGCYSNILDDVQQQPRIVIYKNLDITININPSSSKISLSPKSKVTLCERAPRLPASGPNHCSISLTSVFMSCMPVIWHLKGLAIHSRVGYEKCCQFEIFKSRNFNVLK